MYKDSSSSLKYIFRKIPQRARQRKHPQKQQPDSGNSNSSTVINLSGAQA
jgi:hypothetical protein